MSITALRKRFAETMGNGRLERSHKFVTITPELAAEWLEKNKHNRPKMGTNQTRLVREIRNGRWKVNGDTIKFDWFGILLDGQHRLMAIVEAGVAVECLVVWGLDPDVFPTIDEGSRRTAGHHLATLGKSSYNILGAAVSELRRYERGNLGSTTAVDKMVSGVEVVETMARYPEIEDSIPFGRAVRGIMSPSQATFFHFAFAQHDQDLADAFFEALATGAGLQPTDAVYHLRERLIKEKMDTARTTSRRWLQAMVIKAWNKTVNGEEVKSLFWREGESFPEIAAA